VTLSFRESTDEKHNCRFGGETLAVPGNGPAALVALRKILSSFWVVDSRQLRGI
jgi:hypothetical protein